MRDKEEEKEKETEGVEDFVRALLRAYKAEESSYSFLRSADVQIVLIGKKGDLPRQRIGFWKKKIKGWNSMECPSGKLRCRLVMGSPVELRIMLEMRPEEKVAEMIGSEISDTVIRLLDAFSSKAAFILQFETYGVGGDARGEVVEKLRTIFERIGREVPAVVPKENTDASLMLLATRNIQVAFQ